MSGVGCEENLIQGTYIVYNTGNGIHIVDGPKHNHIGGDLPGMRNLISLNGGYGVYLAGSTEAVERNHVVGNSVGTDSIGTAAWGNGFDGVHLTGSYCTLNDVSYNVIGDNGVETIETQVEPLGGRIKLPVPPGEHTVEARFEETASRLAGKLAGVLGVLGVLVGLGGYAFRAVRDAEDILPDHDAADLAAA